MCEIRVQVIAAWCLPQARDAFIAHKVFSKTLFKSQFPHESVNVSFIPAIVKDTLTDL